MFYKLFHASYNKGQTKLLNSNYYSKTMNNDASL